MLIIAVTLNILCAAGIVVFALKYLLGPVPTDYHSEMLTKEGTTPSETIAAILSALYRITGFSLIAVAISLVAITLIGVQADNLRAKILALVIGLIVGVPSLIITRRMEQRSGVKTPWRLAAILSAGIIAAFVLAIIEV